MQVRISDGGDLRKLAKDLRKHGDGKALRRELVKGMKAEVKPLESKVKAAYRSGPSKGGPRRRAGGSLRANLAKATTTQVRLSGRVVGVSLRVAGKKMPSGMGRLPKLYEGEANRGRWRHPVFGDKNTSVQQSTRRTFYRIVAPHVRTVRRRVEKVADEIARRVAKG